MIYNKELVQEGKFKSFLNSLFDNEDNKLDKDIVFVRNYGDTIMIKKDNDDFIFYKDIVSFIKGDYLIYGKDLNRNIVFDNFKVLRVKFAAYLVRN